MLYFFIRISGPELGRDEVACQSDRGSSFTTGGGFSNIYSRPSWQDKSHDDYFASISHDLPYVNASIGSTGYFPFARYNRMGRGYPDISIIGESAILLL
jgi:tripeptidyl-peptidase I